MTRRPAWLLAILLALLPATCARPPPPVAVRYVLGGAYSAGGVWFYPEERFAGEQTGIAAIYSDGHAPLTTDGEAFDQAALAAAHQTLQLPAIARITNLETGRQVMVRINDRGPPTPHRLVAVTKRTAQLLGMTGPARVRLEIMGAESHRLTDALGGGAAPRLGLQAVPQGAVQSADLPPPPGIGQTSRGGATAVSTPAAVVAPTAAAPVPLRLPEQVTQTAPDPGELWLALGSFDSYGYAAMQSRKVASLGPGIVSTGSGHSQKFRVRIGPFTTIAQADAALDQVLAAGVTDARIVVE